MTLEQIESCIARVQAGLGYLKEARRQAKRVYTDDQTIKFDLKIALSDLKQAAQEMEDQWLD